MKALNMKIEDLRNCNDLIIKHGAALHRSLSELESIDSVADISAKIKALNERATLFRITSNAMIKVCNLVIGYETVQLMPAITSKIIVYDYRRDFIYFI